MDSRKPVTILALATMAFVAGGFLLLVSIGSSERNARGLRAGVNLPATEPPPTTYFGDAEKGAGIVKQKAENLLDSVFGGTAQAPAATAEPAAAARQGSGGNEEGDAGYDSIDKFFAKHNIADDDSGEPDNARSFGDSSSGGSSPGGGTTVTSAGTPARQGQAGRDQRKEDGEPAAASGTNPTASAHGQASGGVTVGGASAPPLKLYAALPKNNSSRTPGLNSGGQPDRGDPGQETGGGKLQKEKGGSLSGLPGGKAAALDGAEEGMKSGAQSSYNSKMSGGAAAVAASGSGGSSAASSPAAASSDGKTAASSSTDKKTDEKKAKEAPAAEEDGGFDVSGPVEDDSDLLKAVVTDRQNGTENKYVTPDEAAGDPDETLLAAGAVAGEEVNKDISTSAPLPKDPEVLAKLSPERKKELRKEVHAFLKQVENKYGKMREIHHTPCKSTPELCKDHEISGTYITMTTERQAKLVLGVKYVKTRWHRYTIDFQAPPGEISAPGFEEAAPVEDVPVE